MEQCSYCGGRLEIDRIESAGGGFRHYSPIDCRDTLKAENAKLRSDLLSLGMQRGAAMVKLDVALLKLGEAITALEISKVGTIHVMSGHIYEPDGKLAEFVDGCARCRIEKVLTKTEKPKGDA